MGPPAGSTTTALPIPWEPPSDPFPFHLLSRRSSLRGSAEQVSHRRLSASHYPNRFPYPSYMTARAGRHHLPADRDPESKEPEIEPGDAGELVADRELLVRVQSGDARAFDALVQR